MLYAITDETLRAIADVIRTKTGDAAPITVSAMPDAIENIQQGGEVGEIEGRVVFENGRIDIIHTQKFNTFISETVPRIHIAPAAVEVKALVDDVVITRENI